MLERSVQTTDLSDRVPPLGGRDGGPPPVAERLAGVLADVLGVPVLPDGDFFDDLGADSLVMARFCARVRKQADLPPVSIQDVYRHRTVTRLAAAVAPPPSAERAMADVLADVLGVPVEPDGDFFDDLGADSLVMARFCARVRKRADLPAVSIQDVYRHPTVRQLATALDTAAAAPAPLPAPPPAPIARRASAAEHALCGVLQLLVFLAYSYLVALLFVRGELWISDADGALDVYARAAVFGGAAFLGLCLLPVAVKWLLLGRTRPREIRVWSLTYVRFWVVKTLVRMNPLVLLFHGSPLFVLYLRALGARVGRGAVVFARQVPVCADLLTVGAGTVVRKDALISCYRATAGVITTGPVTLGRDVVVGEAAVLDIDTAMGDGAQLGHRSSLHTGQRVPAGASWHGSPAQPAGVDYRVVEPADCGTARRVVYSLVQLTGALLVTVPLAIGGIGFLLAVFPQLTEVLDAGPVLFTQPVFYLEVLLATAVLLLGSLVVGLLVALTVPRVLHLWVVPDRVHRLYGFQYSLHRTILRTSNIKPLTKLFGDSSAITTYLQAIGYDLSTVVQTGSNFGTGVKHETPFLSRVGSGTMVADGLSMANADYSSTSFRVSRTAIGADNFLGNAIVFPAGARTGDDCLLATKVMVPLHGEVRTGVGLLGSPAFEIPRSVQRDRSVDELMRGADPGRLLHAKNRHNLGTAGLFLLGRWTDLSAVTLLSLAAAEFYPRVGAVAVAAASVASVLFHLVFTALVERAAAGFRPQQPRICSILDRAFWSHERYWKLVARPDYLNGTPFKPLMWRLLGVRIGRRVFDDGCGMPERTLVTIGDECTLNAGSTIQCHSQEDGAFKLDRITVGAGVTVGVGTWVHYAVTVGDGAEIAPDSFLMKGEEVPPHGRWGGNPAVPLAAAPPALPAGPHDGTAVASARPAPPPRRGHPARGRHRPRPVPSRR
ncbi:Pls/PosA family non-ribosomal peptide synthetase [Geodermatophilus sp. CPCC 206100]|uniref:Pls/PosA family non-ribosomal peptide synthetase n=1 Tax=Geodermatophilus sp. CPCC 206100 TaxID=3020054 RepID=UPI003B00CE0C